MSDSNPSPSSTLRILVIEDNPADAELINVFLKEGLRASFTVERASNLAAGLRRLAQGGLDIVLLDLWLPDSDGIDTFYSVYSQVDPIPIVVLSGVDEEAVAMSAVRHGAQDYLVKGKADSELLARSLQFAIERSARGVTRTSGDVVVTRGLAEITIRMARLSARELEVLDRIVDGKSIKEIATIHGTSYNTVKNQRARILEKLQAESNGDLVRMALTVRFGKEPPPSSFLP